MKGQAAMEFLVIAAAFLAVLVLWLGGAANATSALTQALESQTAKSSLSSLASSANTVCVMGDKNSVSLDFFVHSNATLNCTNKKLMLFTNNQTFEKNVFCDATTISQLNAGYTTLKVLNNKGTVEITL